MKHATVILFTLILIPITAMASGILIVPPPRHDPTRQAQPIQLTQVDVTVEIEDQVALTRIEQEFYNPNGRQLEGTYLFPLPAQSHIESFSMLINGKPTPAELLDADKALKIYEDIVRRMRDPALLQYCGQGTLKARVFPIQAHGKKHITISYRQVLPKDHGLVGYRLPLSRDTGGATQVHVELNTTADIHTIYSPTHDIQHKRRDPRHISLNVTHQDHADRDFELFFASGEGDIQMNSLFHRQSGQDGFAMLLISPDIDVEKRNLQSKDIAFVLDTSGSMAGDKMRQAQSALKFCLENLRPEDRFAVIRFSTEASPFSSEWSSGDRIRDAIGFVDDLQAIGGTNLQEALQLVGELERRNDRMQAVVLLTDGKPTIGERDETKLLEILQGGPRIFSFGIGNEINTHLLDKLVRNNRGARAYVHPNEDIEIKVSHLFAKIQSPVLTDLQITVKGAEFDRWHPKPLPDLFAGSELALFGRFEDGGKATMILKGTLNGKRKTYRYPLDLPEREPNHSFIPRLWATRRVGYLLDQIRLNGESKELIDEVVRISKRYGVISPYTSYLILEDEPTLADTPDPEPLRERYSSMSEKSGARSVQASEDLDQMVSAQSLPASPPKRSGRGFAETRFCAGRTFLRKGESWIDSELSDWTRSSPMVLRRWDDAYFKLLRDHPQLGVIYALDGQIDFAFEGRHYRIIP